MSSKEFSEKIESEHTIQNDENVDESAGDEKSTEENFDEEILELMKKINGKIRYNNNLLIIFQSKPEKDPIVLMNGHPYDVVSMTSGFMRDVKSKLINDLEC